MLNSQSGLPRSKTLEQNTVQLRSFPRVAQQCKYHLPLMVVGKIKKMFIAAIQHEEIMFASSGAGQNLVSQIHAVAQNQSMNILMAKLWGQALLADYAPNQCLDPHFRFVAPLHQGAAAVVGHEDAGGRKEYSSGAGTADLRGVDPHFFHFSGTEKSRIDNPAASVTIRRKNCRFFIPIHTYTRIIHGHIGFGQAV